MTNDNNLKIFSCEAHKPLAKSIASIIGVPLGDMEIEHFSDGEINVHIKETVRGCDVFIIQSTSAPVNENMMQLLVAIDALKRASAARITAVMPYYGYARQDRKARARDPITAKMVADILTTVGVDRLLTMDLHAPQIQGFFNIPVDHLLGVPILYDYFKKDYKGRDDVVLVSPDLGSVTRVRKFAEKLNLPIAIIDKRRPKNNVSEVMNIIGDVKDKKLIIIDDLIDTAGTLCNAAAALKKAGATEIRACATHGVLSGPALQRITDSCLDEVLVLNTINMPDEKITGKIKTLSVAPVFAEAIERIHEDLSVSTLFI
ncbi:MAG: ribose-phosphate pyrophosphokinase [Clostridiales bacterium]|nr:ribose-phosphate pyrophosphokinase [Clostridiales bacterium]